MTGPLDRPSQGALENRKASDLVRPAKDGVRTVRRTVSSMHAAERQLLFAGQQTERKQVIAAINAGLRSQHGARVAAVVSRFADRRAAVAQMIDSGARAAASQQLATEEANELARLALEHASEKRHLKQAALAQLKSVHKAARQSLMQGQRRQRAGLSVQLRSLRSRPDLGRARRSSLPPLRVRISRRRLPGLVHRH